MEPGPGTHKALVNLFQCITLACQKWKKRLQQVVQLKEAMDILEGSQWGKLHSQWQAVTDFLNNKDYNKALDDLERLVVMCLLELMKLNQSEVGELSFITFVPNSHVLLAYDKWTNIWKKLKTHAEAIKNAVKCYNHQAALLDPPQEQVDINQSLKHSFISDFNLLHLSWEDIWDKPWAQPANHEAMARHFQIKAVQDKIVRLDMEIWRLVTSIIDEAKDMATTIQTLVQINQPLTVEIEARWGLWRCINCELVTQILKLTQKNGFQGSVIPGWWEEQMDEGDRAISEGLEQEDIIDDVGEVSEDDDLIDVAISVEKWEMTL